MDRKSIGQSPESARKRALRFADLTAKIDNTRDDCRKADLVCTDMFAEIYSDVPSIDNLKLRLDMMSDYITVVKKALEDVSELADVLKSVVDKWNNRAAENVQNENEGGYHKG